MLHHIILTLLLLCAGNQTKPPSELLQAFRQRGDFRSAQFSYRYTSIRPGRPVRIKNLEQLIVGDDVLQTDKGDDDGIRLIESMTGKPMLGVGCACNRKYNLISRNPGRTWAREDGMGFVFLVESEQAAVYEDVRLIGLAPWSGQNETLDDHLLALDSLPFKKWRVETKEGLLCATGWLELSEDGGYAYEWRLDPERDMVIVEVATIKKNAGVEKRGVIASHDYQQVGDIWWPKKTSLTFDGGVQYCVEYQQIKFNDKSHPKKLTLEAMGVPVGARVRVDDLGEGGLMERRYAGDGETMSEEEFKSKESTLDLSALNRYRLEQRNMYPGTYPAWWNDGSGDYGLSDRKHDLDAWEAYVRRWKLRHTIDVPDPIEQKQVTAADALLKQCRDRAQNIMKRDEKSKVDKAITDKKLAGIFDELKKRLEGILASSQTADVKADMLPRQTGDR